MNRLTIDNAVQMVLWIPRKIDRQALLRKIETVQGKEFADGVKEQVKQKWEARA